MRVVGRLGKLVPLRGRVAATDDEWLAAEAAASSTSIAEIVHQLIQARIANGYRDTYGRGSIDITEPPECDHVDTRVTPIGGRFCMDCLSLLQ